MKFRDRLKGMLVGGAIGDALGLPVETWTPQRIFEVHPGGVKRYVEAKEHKWYDPQKTPPGSWSDDSQLTIATLEAIIDSIPECRSQINLIPIIGHAAKRYVEAMNVTTDGWGVTTKEAVRRLSNGVSPLESGKTNEPNRGTGNGTLMKVSPMSALFASGMLWEVEASWDWIEAVIALSAMTHYTRLAAEASLIHAHVMSYCFMHHQDLNLKYIVDTGSKYTHEWLKGRSDHLTDTGYYIKDRMDTLKDFWESGGLQKATIEEIRFQFGGGSCYVYDSLPFAYAFFLRNHNSMQAIIDVVEAGGDTDTNAKLVGEMLGAVHGLSFFQTPENRWAIEGLCNYRTFIDLADRFCDALGIE